MNFHRFTFKEKKRRSQVDQLRRTRREEPDLRDAEDVTYEYGAF